ncbi:hypothetical protein Tco_0926680 [Tanacetum coccineum]|uniref:Uncharacterized protein n=1 Tax=Tanacetum coccineum TaxID=301880 RepID=A0ABQ5DAL0_9ASTR
MIQPEPEGSTQGYPLDSVEVLRFYTLAGNPVKEILLKLNLPDHRSILTDSKEQIKMEIERRSVKVKELRERCIIIAFKLSNQERRSLLYFSPSTSGLTNWVSTHLKNLYISKKIPSQCRYQVHTLDSSNLSLLTSTPTILGLDTSS